jgi:hypothetical protein
MRRESLSLREIGFRSTKRLVIDKLKSKKRLVSTLSCGKNLKKRRIKLNSCG